MSDKSFAGANIYPLTKQHFDSYTLTEAGPMAASEANVKFERDQDGYGISCRVGGHLYSRGFLGHGTGGVRKLSVCRKLLLKNGLSYVIQRLMLWSRKH